MVFIIIILTIFNLLPQHDAYQITYYDCDAPTSIHTYASHQLCDTEPGERRHNTKMAYLLQQRRVDHLSGFHCQVWRSTFKYKCGVWGHLKTLSPPEILHDYELTVSECHKVVTSGQYTTPAGTKINIEVGATVDWGEIGIGGLEVDMDGSLRCQGVTAQEGGRVIPDEVRLNEWKVAVREVKFAAQGQAVEVVDEQVSLDCGLDAQGCATGEGTYFWHPLEGTARCPLEYIRTVHLEPVEDGLLYDGSAKVLLNLTHGVAFPTCPVGAYSATNHHNIITMLEPSVAETDYLALESVELDIEAHLAMRLDAEKYAQERARARLRQGRGHPVCHVWGRADTAPGPHHLDGTLFAINRGQVT